MYKIHELANIVAMANEHEQIALTEDIKQHGQREPAVLWHNQIVDGRCRQLACLTLGIELQVKELDDELSEEDVAKVVKSLNTRRNLTQTQKMMSAFKQQEESWKTNEEVSKQWGIPLGSYKNARYVATNRPEFVDPLFDGKSIVIYDIDKERDITTDKINTIARIIKKEKERKALVVDKSEEVTFSVDGIIKTEAGKAWYYNHMNDIFTDNMVDPKIAIGMLLVELANLKFKAGDDNEE